MDERLEFIKVHRSHNGAEKTAKVKYERFEKGDALALIVSCLMALLV